MKFETFVAKYETHEVHSEIQPKLPTVKLFENNQYALGIALHKWETTEGTSKGKYLAVYIICGFEDSWESIDLTNAYDILQNECDVIKSYDFNSLQNQTCDDESIVVYKFSVNVWRRVELQGKKSKKWAFVDEKPSKEDHSRVQRLLLT